MSVENERLGRVVVITIRREHKRNAIDAAITAGLDAALNNLEDDPELWCGILTGGQKVFSAGADLASGTGDPTPRGGPAGIIRRHRTKPLIAAVEGYAIGGGMEMVLCCDLVVAARTAMFGLPEVKRGLMPDFGGAFRVARMLPANVAREMLLTGAAIVNAEISGNEEPSWERSDAAHARLVASEDVREGIEAFFGHRAPRWHGC